MSSNGGAAFGFTPSSGRIKHIRLAPFGWHTRYLLRGYIRCTFIVTSCLLLVALTIDLTQWLTKVLASRPEATGLEAVALVAWYIALRSADILARNLSLTIYLGVIWCEFTHTISSERVAVGVTGRSPMQCLVPAVVLGVLLGCVQIGLDVWLRPAAVVAQTAEHLGNLGERFDRRPTNNIQWIKIGDDLVSARVEFGPPPVLRDVTLYRREANGQLHEVVIAHMAVPALSPSMWKFTDGFYWDWTEQAQTPNEAADSQAAAAPLGRRAFARREISLDLDPLWLANMGIDGKYLSQSILEALASSASPGIPKSDYRTWLQVRYARGFYILGMVLLAASLAQVSLRHLPRFYGLFGILLAGYFGHVAQKALEIMGEQDAVPPIVAGWLVPFVLITSALFAQWRAYRTVD